MSIQQVINHIREIARMNKVDDLAYGKYPVEFIKDTVKNNDKFSKELVQVADWLEDYKEILELKGSIKKYADDNHIDLEQATAILTSVEVDEYGEFQSLPIWYSDINYHYSVVLGLAIKLLKFIY